MDLVYVVKQKNRQLVPARKAINHYPDLLDNADNNLKSVLQQFQSVFLYMEDVWRKNPMNAKTLTITLSTTNRASSTSLKDGDSLVLNMYIGSQLPTGNRKPTFVKSIQKSILNLSSWILAYGVVYASADTGLMMSAKTETELVEKANSARKEYRAKIKKGWQTYQSTEATPNKPSSRSVIKDKILEINHISVTNENTSLENDIMLPDGLNFVFYDKRGNRADSDTYIYAKELIGFIAEEYAFAVDLIGHDVKLVIECYTKVRKNAPNHGDYTHNTQDRPTRRIRLHLTQRLDNNVPVLLSRVKSTVSHEFGHMVHSELWEDRSVNYAISDISSIRRLAWNNAKIEHFAKRYSFFRGHKDSGANSDKYLFEIDDLYSRRNLEPIAVDDKFYDESVEIVMSVFYDYIKNIDVAELKGLHNETALNIVYSIKQILEKEQNGDRNA